MNLHVKRRALSSCCATTKTTVTATVTPLHLYINQTLFRKEHYSFTFLVQKHYCTLFTIQLTRVWAWQCWGKPSIWTTTKSVTLEMSKRHSHLWGEKPQAPIRQFYSTAITASTWINNKIVEPILYLKAYNNLENLKKKRKKGGKERFWHVVQLMVYETCRGSSQH